MYSLTVGWLIMVAFCAIIVASVSSLLNNNKIEMKIGVYFAVLTAISGIIGLRFYTYGRDIGMEEGEKSHTGSSIQVAKGNYEGKVLRPLGVVANGNEILLIDTDRKLYYSLVGTIIENGLSPTNMVDKELILYRKGGSMYIGIKEPEIHSIPSGFYPTNKVEK